MIELVIAAGMTALGLALEVSRRVPTVRVRVEVERHGDRRR